MNRRELYEEQARIHEAMADLHRRQADVDEAFKVPKACVDIQRSMAESCLQWADEARAQACNIP